ncbi:hypothetical protein PVAND_000470 [Polypedilum vanderplanki]|uniref:DNA-directed RNA polymerase II subunit GRINL1A n=1 Tax=Polypedilum vanderplanki TaxID=319348 RepID=A0A9J6BKE5_POLVA|nr:hypothetical protein PVAND_000470 [Polypedilum vanderplanki]
MDSTVITNHPLLKKVPGEPKKEKEYALNKDLTKLSRRELLDLKSRQTKLLENRHFINRLPDKGEKIKNLYDRIVEALEYRTDIENASKLLSKLNIGSNNLNNLEWEGSIQIKKPQTLDSDDEEQNPLEILASSNSTFKNQKIVKKSNDPNEKPLITEEDLKEANEIINGELHLNPVDEKICEREKLELEYRFLPYKSTEFKKKKEEDDKKKEPKKREVTAATPPVILKGTVPLTLKESLDIELHHQTVMKQLLEKQAVERLEAKMKELKAAGLEISSSPEIVPRSKVLSMKKYRLPDPIIDECDLVEDEDEDKSDDSLTDEENEEY